MTVCISCTNVLFIYLDYQIYYLLLLLACLCLIVNDHHLSVSTLIESVWGESTEKDLQSNLERQKKESGHNGRASNRKRHCLCTASTKSYTLQASVSYDKWQTPKTTPTMVTHVHEPGKEVDQERLGLTWQHSTTLPSYEYIGSASIA